MGRKPMHNEAMQDFLRMRIDKELKDSFFKNYSETRRRQIIESAIIKANSMKTEGDLSYLGIHEEERP